MALFRKPYYRNCHFFNLTEPARCGGKNVPLRVLASGVCYRNYFYQPLYVIKPLESLSGSLRACSTQRGDNSVSKPNNETESPKPSLFQRFKQMYRDYWYVLVPVHMVTSAVWYGSCYYAVRSGIDVLAILEWMNVSEKLMSPLKDSSAGYFALAFALYKIATPLRYAVTVDLGIHDGEWALVVVTTYQCGTTIAIKKLTAIGWIKPVPSRERIKEMLQERKDNLQDRFNESKQHYQCQMQEKRSQMMEEMRRYKTEMRNLKNKVKKT